jgi:hypothetical protein
MELLDLTQAKCELIISICNLEHESLLRLHTNTSTISPRINDYLRKLGISEDEYKEYALDYHSEAYFGFQRVLETPALVSKMPAIFMAVVLEIIDAYQDELMELYGEEVVELANDLLKILGLYPGSLNFN